MGIEDLLKRLKNGEFDGVNYEKWGDNGSLTELSINDGVPTRKYSGKTQRYFNGKENEKWYKTDMQTFDTDEKKKDFIRRYGFIGELFNHDEDAKSVSGEFYKKRNDKK